MFLSQLPLPSIALVLTSDRAYHPSDANMKILDASPLDFMTTIDERESESAASNSVQMAGDDLAASPVQHNLNTEMDTTQGQTAPDNRVLSSGATHGLKHKLSFAKSFLKKLLPVKTPEPLLRKFMMRH